MEHIKISGEPLFDEVIKAKYCIGTINYKDSIVLLYPLIKSLDIQRNLQATSFYSRLRDDLKSGCIIPAITVAFIIQDTEISELPFYINQNIHQAFILDGIQRLNAISQAYNEIEDHIEKEKFEKRILHLNIIIAPSIDKLLYRMITLNNGQKPMSPQHQIDILTQSVLDFENLKLKNQTQKQKQLQPLKYSINRSDIVKGFTAYLSGTIFIDNKLIIEEKMNELIAEKIINSDVPNENQEFLQVLEHIAELCDDEEINKWFSYSNNFVGYCVACRSNFIELRSLTKEDFLKGMNKFEQIFLAFDKKKIKIGEYRRKIISEYFSKYSAFLNVPDSDIILKLSSN